MKGTKVYYDPNRDIIVLFEYNDLKKYHRSFIPEGLNCSFMGMASRWIHDRYRKYYKYLGEL
jgi:hypothetical protein